MKIESADVHRVEVPMHTSYRAAVHDFSTMDAYLVVLTAPDGTEGVGTVDPSPGYSRQTPPEIRQGLSKILPQILDDCPDNPNQLSLVLGAIDGEENAKCGVEMAYLDLYCRQREMSFQEFFGGSLRATESLNGWVGVDDPESMVERTLEYEAAGFESVKLKLNGESETDIERVKAVCRATGDEMEVRADVNGAYDVRTAVRVAQALEEFPLEHLEQPVPLDDIDGLEEVTQSTTTTIMADECLLSLGDVYEVLARKAADRIKVKTLRLGGMLPTRRALDVASAAGVPAIVGHGFGLSPSTSSELQLTTSHENVVTPVESVGMLKMESEPFDPVVSVEQGSALIPEGSGHGIRVDDARLSEFLVDTDQYL